MSFLLILYCSQFFHPANLHSIKNLVLLSNLGPDSMGEPASWLHLLCNVMVLSIYATLCSVIYVFNYWLCFYFIVGLD